MFIPAVWLKVALGMLVVGGTISVPVIYNVSTSKHKVNNTASTSVGEKSYNMTEAEKKQYEEYKKQKQEIIKTIRSNYENIKTLTTTWNVSEVARTSKQAETNDFEWVAMWRKDFVPGIKEKYDSLKREASALLNAESNSKQQLDLLIQKQTELSKKLDDINLNMDRLNSYKG